MLATSLAAGDGYLLVLCSAGVGRTGVFVTLSIVLERMRYEGVVDMFQTVKILRTQRPAMVQSEVEATSDCIHIKPPAKGGLYAMATSFCLSVRLSFVCRPRSVL